MSYELNEIPGDKNVIRYLLVIAAIMIIFFSVRDYLNEPIKNALGWFLVELVL